jgi:hypothetical protein
MKHLLLVSVIFILIVFGASCKIVNPFLIALNLPLEVCALMDSGNSWNEVKTYNITQEIKNVNASYVDKIKATRVSDITVSIPNPPSSGTVTGTISYAFDSGTPTTLASFSNVPFDSLAGAGVSLLHTSLITYNPAALATLLSVMQNPSGLPTIATVTIQTSGTTSVTVPQDTEICVHIYYQADAQI